MKGFIYKGSFTYLFITKFEYFKAQDLVSYRFSFNK